MVATPGRLLDLMGQGYIHLKNVKYFVLDEADRMLDMGMIHDVKRIIAELPQERQTMLFSATMPTEIARLSGSLLKNPVKIEITPVASTVDVIEQSVYYVNKINKIHLLIHILENAQIESALVFSRTKHGADKIVKALEKSGMQAQAIHGNKSQNARQLALGNFKSRKTKILVATDIAARGIDVEELSHVIIFDLPEVPETYVHRIGRTGRAGLGGVAISFCDQEEKPLLRDIQKLILKNIPVVENHPFPLDTSISDVSEKSEHRFTGRQMPRKQAITPKKMENAKPVRNAGSSHMDRQTDNRYVERRKINNQTDNRTSFERSPSQSTNSTRQRKR